MHQTTRLSKMKLPVDQPDPLPADARPHPRWPLWKILLAYLVLAAVAFFAIWYIDLKAHSTSTGQKDEPAVHTFSSLRLFSKSKHATTLSFCRSHVPGV